MEGLSPLSPSPGHHGHRSRAAPGGFADGQRAGMGIAGSIPAAPLRTPQPGGPGGGELGFSNSLSPTAWGEKPPCTCPTLTTSPFAPTFSSIFWSLAAPCRVFLTMKRRREVLVPAARRGCGCCLQEVFAPGFACLQPRKSCRRSRYLCSSIPVSPQVTSQGGNRTVIPEGWPEPGSEPQGCKSALALVLQIRCCRLCWRCCGRWQPCFAC